MGNVRQNKTLAGELMEQEMTTITFRLTKEEKETLKAIADKKYLNLSQVIREYVRNGLEKETN